MEPLFASPTLAAGYARSRPAVHPRVIDRVRRHLGLAERVGCAVDVGCGAGLSTRPLAPLARMAVGIEPLEPMLAWTRETAPDAHFVVGRAEALPFCDGAADLLTAAGSLNYVDLARFFPEAKRILRRGGRMVVYDFSQGRTMADSPALRAWHDEFMRRYPAQGSTARPLDPELLVPLAEGFRPAGAERFEEALPMDADFYVDYTMTATNVAAAVRRGEDEDGIRAWCRQSLAPVFEGRRREVMFTGYIAYFDTLAP